MGGTPRLRLAGANRDWLQPCRRAGRRPRWPEGIAGANARSRDRLFDGVRRHDGKGAPVARRRQLACPRIAGADRTMDLESRSAARWAQDGRLEGWGGQAICRRGTIGLRPAAIDPPLGGAVENHRVLGAPGDAARQSPAAMAGARLSDVGTCPQFLPTPIVVDVI